MSIEIMKRPYEKVFSGNPVHYELYSALAAGDPSVSFEVKVLFKKIGVGYTYEEVVSLPYAPKDGYANVDLKEILDSVLEFDLPTFEVDESTPYRTDKQTGKFYLQFREITSANPEPDWDDSESAYERFVIKGGLNDFKYQGNNFWLNFYDVVKPFLTWQPSGTRQLADGGTEPVRIVAAEERMYLAWLINTDLAGASLKVRIYYTDGTAANKIVPLPVSTPKIGTIFYLPVGCDQLGLKDVTPAKTIFYWTVQVIDVNDNSEFSEIFKYELDNRNDYISITLTYRNSLGGLDSQRVRGSLKKRLGYTFSELEKTIEPDYFDGHYFSPQKVISGNLEQLVYSGNLGLLRKEEQDRLRDAQMIRETWTVRNKKWVPMNIITKDFDLTSNTDKLFSMPIEFTLGYAGSEYYTPDNVDLGEGVFTSNVCRAFISPLTVTRDAVSGDDKWVINAGENDPQNASDQFRYRIVKDSDGSVLLDWATDGYGLPIPLTMPNDTGIYTLEAQPICTNNVLGKVSTVKIDTATVGGGGTPPPPPPAGNSYMQNHTSTQCFWGVDIDSGGEVDTDFVGANNVQDFTTTSVGTFDILVTFDFSPAFVGIGANGVAYPGTLVGPNQWLFTGVTIVDGIIIDIY